MILGFDQIPLRMGKTVPGAESGVTVDCGLCGQPSVGARSRLGYCQADVADAKAGFLSGNRNIPPPSYLPVDHRVLTGSRIVDTIGIFANGGTVMRVGAQLNVTSAIRRGAECLDVHICQA